MLICPVRGCGQPLVREAKRIVCKNAHSFDVARSGYVNLLQPQDRKSKNPGDSAAVVKARGRLHDLGVTQPLFDAIAEFSGARPDDVVLDAGCGDGFYLGNLTRESGCQGHGVDLSIPAIDAAAKRYPDCEWIVANADRLVPYADRSFSLILSITARMNGAEFRRVLHDNGRLLVAIPAPDDLIELRGVGKDRVARTVESFSAAFKLREHRRVSTTADLDAETAKDALHAIYRPMRSEPVGAMKVTFSLDLLLFRDEASCI